MSDFSRYIGLFLEEAADHLQALERFASHTDEDGGDPHEHVKEAFRAAHSIKGAAATVGLDAIADLAHALEDLLDHLRDAPADRKTLGFVVEATDHLQAATDALRAGGDADAKVLARATQRLRQHHATTREGSAHIGPEQAGHAGDDRVHDVPADDDRAGPSGPVPAAVRSALEAAAAAPASGAVHALRFLLRRGCIAPRARLIVARRAIENHGEMVACVPPEEEWADLRTQERPQQVVIAVRVKDRAVFDDLVARVALVPDLEDVQEVTLDQRHLDALGGDAPRASASGTDATGAGPDAAGAEMPGEASGAPGGAGANTPTQNTVRVHVEHLDRLLDMVGELKIAQNALDRLLRRAPVERRDPYVMDDALRSMDLGLREVYEEVLEIRTLPASVVTDRLPRIARHAARHAGKRVQLHVDGASTQLDRSVIEALADPLMHLVRNAVDHGIEAPDERRRAGKPATGHVRVRIQKVSSGVRVEVKDDGAGIDLERVRAKAVQRGMYSAEEAASMQRKDWARVLDVLTHSGFSTAEEVGDISGRGVGLDVVRSRVEGIGGNMALVMPDSGGTSFRLSLPANLSVTEAFACEIDGQTYYVPAGAVVAGLALTPAQVSEGVIRPRTEPQVHPLVPASHQTTRGDASEEVAYAAGPASADVPPEPDRVGRALISHASAREVVDRDIPIITLTGTFHTQTMRYGSEGREHMLGVVIERHGRRACLLVDRLGTMEEIVVKRFLHPLLPLPLVTGATVRPDGRVAVILDTSDLFRRSRSTARRPQ